MTIIGKILTEVSEAKEPMPEFRELTKDELKYDYSDFKGKKVG